MNKKEEFNGVLGIFLSCVVVFGLLIVAAIGAGISSRFISIPNSAEGNIIMSLGAAITFTTGVIIIGFIVTRKSKQDERVSSHKENLDDIKNFQYVLSKISAASLSSFVIIFFSFSLLKFNLKTFTEILKSAGILYLLFIPAICIILGVKLYQYYLEFIVYLIEQKQ